MEQRLTKETPGKTANTDIFSHEHIPPLCNRKGSPPQRKGNNRPHFRGTSESLLRGMGQCGAKEQTGRAGDLPRVGFPAGGARGASSKTGAALMNPFFELRCFFTPGHIFWGSYDSARPRAAPLIPATPPPPLEPPPARSPPFFPRQGFPFPLMALFFSVDSLSPPPPPVTRESAPLPPCLPFIPDSLERFPGSSFDSFAHPGFADANPSGVISIRLFFPRHGAAPFPQLSR